jgi:hypothetical protein
VLARRFVALALVIGAATTGGCGGGSSGGAEPGDDATATTARRQVPAACTLVTAAQARALFGAAVTRPPPPSSSPATDDAVVDSCTYSARKPLQVLTVNVTNDLRVLAGAAYGDSVPTNVGEEAYLRTGDPPGTLTLQFRNRGAVVTLVYSDLRVAGPTAAPPRKEGDLIAVAEQAAARL